MADKTHWKKLNNPDYLGAYAFQPGEEKVVTIKKVTRETVYNPSGGGKEECTVAHFVEPEKPLILNTTNSKMIAKVWGTPYIEDWTGKKIRLKVKKVNAFGETVDAVRVANDRPEEEKPITCEGCGAVITATQGRTPSQIAAATKNKYNRILCMACARKEASNG